MNLFEIKFENLNKIYKNYFTLSFLGNDISNKFAIISLTCYITNELRKKGKIITCYEILLNIGKKFPDEIKNTFLKSLGAICEDMMYGCNTFPTFDIEPKEMPKTLLKLLDNYCPF